MLLVLKFKTADHLDMGLPPLNLYAKLLKTSFCVFEMSYSMVASLFDNSVCTMPDTNIHGFTLNLRSTCDVMRFGEYFCPHI